MLEKEIEQKLIKPIKALGGLCLKFETPGYTGVPDRIILLPGGHVRFVETKQPGKKECARQLLVHRIFRALGFIVYNTVDTPEKVAGVVRDCEEVAHHMDGDKRNNDPANLLVFPSQAEHARWHNQHKGGDAE